MKRKLEDQRKQAADMDARLHKQFLRLLEKERQRQIRLLAMKRRPLRIRGDRLRLSVVQMMCALNSAMKELK